MCLPPPSPPGGGLIPPPPTANEGGQCGACTDHWPPSCAPCTSFCALLCRAWAALLAATSSCCLALFSRGRCVAYLGYAAPGADPSTATPGPICQQAMRSRSANYLGNLLLFPGEGLACGKSITCCCSLPVGCWHVGSLGCLQAIPALCPFHHRSEGVHCLHARQHPGSHRTACWGPCSGSDRQRHSARIQPAAAGLAVLRG